MLSLIATPSMGIPAFGIGAVPAFRKSPFRHAAAIAALALLYYLAARASLLLAFQDTNASPVWPPSGIGFSALLIFGPRLWPGVFIGAFAANLAGFAANHGTVSPMVFAVSAAIGLGNSFEALAAVILARKWMADSVDAIRALKFALLVAAVCALAAAIGTASLCLGGLAPWDLSYTIGRTWWLGDATGLLVVAPFLVSLASLPRRRPPPRLILESVAFLAVLVLFAYGVFDRRGIFGGVQPMAYAITPVLLLIAFRCHGSVVYLGVLLVSGIAILETLAGSGPFSGSDIQEQLLLLQAFAGVISLTLLFVEGSLVERSEATQALQAAKEGLEKRVEDRTAEIRLSESRFRQLSDAGFEGLVIHDMGVIQLANQAAGTMFGVSPGDFVGKTLPEYLAPESIAAALENMGKGSEEPVNSIGMRRDGTRFHMEVRGKPIEYNGKPMRVVAVRDITERIKAEEMQVHAMEALESANLAKSQFLATVSHEIRTPLNGIIGMTHALGDSRLDPEQQRYLSILKSCGEALLDQVNGILDLAKIESGGMDLEATGFALGPMIEDSLRPHAESARRRGLRFIHLSEIPPATVILGDPKRLRQVIGNLVGNAVKFTGEGWVRVETRALDKGGSLELSFAVTDSGIGMDPETLSRLFKPFVQGDASMSRRYGGTGLGLAICKQLVELMGGYLSVDSRKGAGSTFRFKCDFLKSAMGTCEPALVFAADEPYGAVAACRQGMLPRAGAQASVTDVVPPGLGPKVLVVEDDPVNQEVARIFLGKHACSVWVAGSGAEAVSLCATEAFDLILMDCQLPGMDGFATTGALRGADGPNRHARIVAMTANAIQGDRERCLAAGMDDYLAKPLDAGRLAQVIGDLVTGRYLA